MNDGSRLDKQTLEFELFRVSSYIIMRLHTTIFHLLCSYRSWMVLFRVSRQKTNFKK